MMNRYKTLKRPLSPAEMKMTREERCKQKQHTLTWRLAMYRCGRPQFPMSSCDFWRGEYRRGYNE